MKTVEEMLLEHGIYLNEAVSTAFEVPQELKQYVNEKGKFEPPKDIHMVSANFKLNITSTFDLKDISVITLLLYCYKNNIKGNITDYLLGLKVSKAKSGFLIIEDGAILELNKTDLKVFDIKNNDNRMNAVFSTKGPQRTFTNQGLARNLLEDNKKPNEFNHFVKFNNLTRTEYNFVIEIFDKLKKEGGQIKKSDLSYDSYGVKRDLCEKLIANNVIKETKIGSIKWLTYINLKPKVDDIKKLIKSNIMSIADKYGTQLIKDVLFNGKNVDVIYTQTAISYWSSNSSSSHVNSQEQSMTKEIKELEKDYPDFTFTTKYKLPIKD